MTRADRLALEAGCYYDESFALRVKDFFIRYLRHSKGQFAGKPFHLLDWQYDDVVKPLFGWRRKDGTRRYRVAYIEIPKKNGKDMHINEQIPSPSGWVTMGALTVGDKVYDETGRPCNVVAVSEVFTDHICYRLTFADGTSVVAGENHEWIVKDRHGQRVYCLTSREIYINQKTRDGSNRYSVAVNGYCESDDSPLPVNPYLFGYYLGNGFTTDGRLAVSTADVDAVELMIGRSSRRQANGPNCVNLIVENLRGDIQQFDFKTFRDKRIPRAYLDSGTQQRRDLLAGLMDSDGCAGPKGQCIFVTGLEGLKNDILELLRSLGYKPTARFVDDTWREDRNCAGHWRVLFTADTSRSPFGLARKTASLPVPKEGPTRSDYKAITDVAVVPTVPTKCIQVDSPSRQYLCGEGYIPTHNSTLCAGLSLYFLCADHEPGAEVFSAAGNRRQASIIFNEAATMVRRSPALSQRIEVRDSKKIMKFHPSGSIYEALSADAPSKEGVNTHALLFDELHTQKNRNLWNTLRYSGIARRQPMIVAITTAGDDPTSLCWDEHCYAERILDEEDDTRDDEYFAYIRCADEKDDIDLESTWKKANPSYGITLPAESFESSLREARQKPSMMLSFLRYRLNRWAFGTTGWIGAAEWKACTFADAPPIKPKERCYIGLDLSSVSDISCIAMLFPEDRMRCKLEYFAPNQTVLEREKSKLKRYQYWVDRGLVRVTEGGAIDYTTIEKRVLELMSNYEVLGVGIDPWNAVQFAQTLQGQGVRVSFVRQGYGSLSPPMKELERLVRTKQLVHYGDPVLSWMINNVQIETDANENIKPHKKNSKESIDGVSALLNAIHLWMKAVKSVYNKRGMITA